MRRTITVFLLLLLATAAQAQVSFKIPIFVRIGEVGDTLFLGVNPGNTIGIDGDASFGEFQESMMPPLPPPPFPYDARFITLPGRVTEFPTGLGTGTNRDFRPYIDAAQIDSFRIRVSGELIETLPIVLSWPDNLANYAEGWTIKPQAGTDWPLTNMLTDTTVTIPPLGVPTIIIIKQGARVVNVESFPTPGALALHQNYPNPFNPSTRIAFTVPERMTVSLDVYDVLGRHVRMVAQGSFEAGRHVATFDASGMASGNYFFVLRSGERALSRTFTVLR